MIAFCSDKSTLLATCKPLILLGFARPFNDTRTTNRVAVLTPLFFFLYFSLIILQIYLESVNYLRPPG